MRATVSFDVEIDRVTKTMHSLVSQERGQLLEALDLLDRSKERTLQRDIEDVLDQLEAAAYQLRQYRDMLLSFKNARDGMPENAGAAAERDAMPMPDMKELANQMSSFEGFLDRINSQTEGPPDDTEEG